MRREGQVKPHIQEKNTLVWAERPGEVRGTSQISSITSGMVRGESCNSFEHSFLTHCLEGANTILTPLATQRAKITHTKLSTLLLYMVGWVLLYVHRNRRLIRDGSPERPPRLSHIFWALSPLHVHALLLPTCNCLQHDWCVSTVQPAELLLKHSALKNYILLLSLLQGLH